VFPRSRPCSYLRPCNPQAARFHSDHSKSMDFRLPNLAIGVESIPFFDTMGLVAHLETQPSVREPRENRGRLRHCNGLQTPSATGSRERAGKAGARLSPKSGYRFGCARRGRFCGHLSVKRRMRPAPRACAPGGPLDAFILRFVGGEGFFVSAPAVRKDPFISTLVS
jgi:hypothetical protein